MTTTRTYREDIDWLRAIAVLSVIGFHWEIPPFKGGYVGVDLFFVISGYLITQIIQSELKDGTFSFARFYERRVRRLLPALYAMVALIAVLSFFYLLASERLQLFGSVAAVVTFTSNIFFWMQAGYFDGASGEKPLLHTWSLAVEEQFYLVLPFLVWCLLQRAGTARARMAILLAGLGVATLASFALSIWLMRTDRVAAAFFLSPPRAWEFLVGAILAIEGFPTLRNELLRRAARVVAVIMIAIPVFAYRQGTSFPGVNALLPCVGATVFIWCGIGVPTEHLRPRWLIDTANVIGKMSYSLYLWHWPMFIFAKFSTSTLTLGVIDKALLFALMLAISYASYRFLEQPVRRGAILPTRYGVFTAAAASSAAFLIAVIVADKTELASAGTTQKYESYDHYSYQPVYRFGSCFVENWEAFDATTCLRPEPDKKNILIWGDSLGAHYFHGLASVTNRKDVNILQMTVPACFPTLSGPSHAVLSCDRATTAMKSFFQSAKPGLVIISADWLEYIHGMGFDQMIGDLKNTLAILKGQGISAALIGPTLEFRSRLPAMLARAEVRGSALPQVRDLMLPNLLETDARMKAALPSGGGFTYVSMLDLACPEQQCPLTLAGGVPIVWDHAHLTAEGSDYVAERIVRSIGLEAQ